VKSSHYIVEETNDDINETVNIK